jgi:ferredoxin
MAMNGMRLVLDPTVCDGHGLCAQLFPEGIALDDWGFPLIHGEVRADHLAHARRAVSACPVLALRLVPALPAEPGLRRRPSSKRAAG